MAIPGIYYGIEKKQPIALEYGTAALCLLTGFWFMTSTLEFYNPIYLNPRHLIILVAPLSVCIALGSKHWLDFLQWKLALASLLILAGGYCFIFGDWKIGLFYVLFSGLLFFKQENIRCTAMALGLILPVLFSVYYQRQLKNYPHFIEAFRSETLKVSGNSPLLTHDFIYFSREVLLEEPQGKSAIVSMAEMESLTKNPPETLTLLIYQYYRYAYPAEQGYLDKAEQWIEDNYDLTHSEETPWLSIRKYSRKEVNP